MKKTVAILCTAILLMALFVGCGKKTDNNKTENNQTANQEETVTQTPVPTDESLSATQTPAEKVDVKIASLKGPTSLGLLQMMDEAKKGTLSNNYNFEMCAAADEIVTKVVKGEVDIALLPANVAAVLYKKTQNQVQVVDVNTLGVLYAVEHGDSISSIKDLAGKTVYMTGKGTVPEYALSYILSKNGMSMDDVKVEFKSEPTEVIASLSKDASAIGILPQPFATAATLQDDTLRVALDLNEEWNKVDTQSTFITGVTIVRKEFLDQNKAVVDQFIAEHAASVDYTNANVEDAAALAESFDIVKAPVAKNAIPYCNIVSMTGDTMKEKLSGYLQTLFDANAESVGGTLPDEGFYYTGQTAQ